MVTWMTIVTQHSDATMMTALLFKQLHKSNADTKLCSLKKPQKQPSILLSHTPVEKIPLTFDDFVAKTPLLFDDIVLRITLT